MDVLSEVVAVIGSHVGGAADGGDGRGGRWGAEGGGRRGRLGQDYIGYVSLGHKRE